VCALLSSGTWNRGYAQMMSTSKFFDGLANMYAVKLAVALSAALSLAGCAGGSTGSIFGTAAPADVPAPVAATVAPGKAKLAFLPVVGAPADISSKLNGRVVAAMSQQNIPIAKSAGEGSDYTVRGYVVAAPGKGVTKITYIWDVSDRAGQRANRVKGEELVKTQNGKDPWSAFDDAVIERIAQATTTQLAAWVPLRQPTAAPAGVPVASATTTQSGQATRDTQVAAAPISTLPKPDAGSNLVQPAALTPPGQPAPAVAGQVLNEAPAAVAALPNTRDSAIIVPVTGAPGDGQALLTQAIQRQLSAAGVSIASTRGPTEYSVQGIVTMGPPANGKQTVSIEWMVLDPAGKRVGTARQSNAIPQGSLDGTWGRTADIAAREASKGIADLISQDRKLKESKRQQAAAN
jgi:hypothetical protein